ncbi:MAG TPA: zinc-binding dehydrogenase [Gaiellaceae bacterium]
MRAAVVTELGQPPSPGELPEPAAAEGEVVLKVLAAPLNPLDVAVGSGKFYGGHPELPYVPGAEGVGRVRDSGELVWTFAGGLGMSRNGAMAEFAVAPAERLVPVPEEADPVLAGALGIAGLAGWLPLARRAPVREGETVLVLGATGTVGLVAVQTARLLGAGRIVAAGRNEQGLAQARSAGADATVQLEGDFREELRAAVGEDGATLVFDPVWGEVLPAALDAAAPGARIVHVGQSAGPEACLTSAAVRGKQLDLLGFSSFAVPMDVLRSEYDRLVRHALAGDIRLDVEAVPLEDVSEAWRRQAAGGGPKLVLVP